MNNKHLTYLLALAFALLVILFSLSFIKIDYYELLPHQIDKNNIYVVMDHEPKTVFVNINQKIFEIDKYQLMQKNTYVLDFTINSEKKDKIFCFSAIRRYNVISYIFKSVFNI